MMMQQTNKIIIPSPNLQFQTQFQYYLYSIVKMVSAIQDSSMAQVNNYSFYFQMNRRGKDVTSEQTLLYDRLTKNETKIHLKLAQLKKDKPNYSCRHFQDLPEECQAYDPTINYYQKFWKLFLLNQLSCAKLQASNEELSTLEEKITEAETLFQEHDEYVGGRSAKRNRRQAYEIDKNYACPYPSCYKNYVSEISLNLHIKIKHNGGNKSERDRAAEMICHARDNGLPIPNFYINLPPGFVEEYRRGRRSSGSHQSLFQDDDS